MALFDAHANFAVSSVATAPSPATSGTSLVVSANDGTFFPAVPFNAVVWTSGAYPTSTNSEIVRVTARTTDTLTITRAQEGTSAQSVDSTYLIAASPTAKSFTDIEANVPILTSYFAHASGTLASFTADTAITGATVSVVVTGSSASALIWASFDVSYGASTPTTTCALKWNGSERTEKATLTAPTSATAFRQTISQSWLITGVTAGTYVAQLMASMTVSDPTNTVGGSHTTINAICIDTTN